MLQISKSPLRVSFFGGGTDYPEYFKEFPGAVLGTAINKYIYIVVLPMAGVAATRYRITYRMVETVDAVDEIQHPVIRVALQDLGFDEPLNIAIISDLPGGSGLGSSSSFTVGFVKLLTGLKGEKITKLDLMRRAVRIEHELLRENVGIQDHIHAAFGGLNLYTFQGDEFAIQPVRMTTAFRTLMDSSMMLVYTGIQRHASATVHEQMTRTRERKIEKELTHLRELCDHGLRLLEDRDPHSSMKEFGHLLSEGWEIKRRLSKHVTNEKIDEIYEVAMRMGAYGGKLCGAGGGGFFLFLAPSNVQADFARTFGAENCLPISMEDDGAKFLHS